MSTTAQVIANQSNAQQSTGPTTSEGKARTSQNATKLGLFSTTAFIPPDEREIYDDLAISYLKDLSPKSAIEDSLSDEIIQAAWRLRRCAMVEIRQLTDDDDPADLDRLQASIDRARATAQRAYHRSLAELRRVQSERVYRATALPAGMNTDDLGQADCLKLKPAALLQNKPNPEERERRYQETLARAQAEIAKQTQSIPKQYPRNAQCPCGSGEKYKRCCGTGAPPVLNNNAGPADSTRATE
jgi:hypothetical protein